VALVFPSSQGSQVQDILSAHAIETSGFHILP
jgi:hypothetical protein